MSRPVKQIAAGSRVFFRAEVRDLSDDAQPLFTPPAVPTIELRNPNGVVQVNFANTTEQDIGIFTYTHQTTITDTVGVWRVRFRIVNGADTDYTIPAVAFELVL
jgi:hypothetical protein